MLDIWQRVLTLYQQMMSFAALCMALVAVLAGISFISLGICYLYGSGISENNDEIVSENIDNFENL